MKHRLLTILNCPKCKSSFKLTVERQLKSRIIKGNLICKKCNANFEIINEIVCFKLITKKECNYKEIEKAKRMFCKELKGGWLKHYKKQELRALKREWQWMLQELNLGKSKIHLDWATGTGRFLREILKKTKGDIIALEVDYATCVGLKEFLKKIKKYSRVSIICGDAKNMPFKDNSFDGVSSWHGIDEPHIKKALSEAKRVLKRNKKISVSGFFIKDKSKSLKTAAKMGMEFVKEDVACKYFQKLSFKDVYYQTFFEGKWLERKSFLPRFGDNYAIYGISGKK